MRVEEPDDLLILCASYEERALTSSQCLAPSYKARRAVIYINEEFLCGASGAPARGNLYTLVERAARHCEKVDVTEGSLTDPQKQLASLRSALEVTALGQKPN